MIPKLRSSCAICHLTLSNYIGKQDAYFGAKIVSVHPTDYDPETNYFDTRSVEGVIKDIIARNPQAIKEGYPGFVCGIDRSRVIKLFANTYLAMRVLYFNELGTYAATHDLDTVR